MLSNRKKKISSEAVYLQLPFILQATEQICQHRTSLIKDADVVYSYISGTAKFPDSFPLL